MCYLVQKPKKTSAKQAESIKDAEREEGLEVEGEDDSAGEGKGFEIEVGGFNRENCLAEGCTTWYCRLYFPSQSWVFRRKISSSPRLPDKRSFRTSMEGNLSGTGDAQQTSILQHVP